MRFSTLAILFTAVSTIYALPLRAKDRRDLLAILNPRTDDAAVYGAQKRLEYLKEPIRPTEIKGEASQKIIDAYSAVDPSLAEYWLWENWPRGSLQRAAYTKLNKDDKDDVWIIASGDSIPDSNVQLFGMECQSILSLERNKCLIGWTKNDKDQYHLVSKTDERCHDLGKKRSLSEISLGIE